MNKVDEEIRRYAGKRKRSLQRKNNEMFHLLSSTGSVRRFERKPLEVLPTERSVLQFDELNRRKTTSYHPAGTKSHVSEQLVLW